MSEDAIASLCNAVYETGDGKQMVLHVIARQGDAGYSDMDVLADRIAKIEARKKSTKAGFPKQCRVCSSVQELRVCKDCHGRYYCSRAHQKQHWRESHHSECAELRQANAYTCSGCRKSVSVLQQKLRLVWTDKTGKSKYIMCSRCYPICAKSENIVQTEYLLAQDVATREPAQAV